MNSLRKSLVIVLTVIFSLNCVLIVKAGGGDREQ